jgi:hypothetical protein
MTLFIKVFPSSKLIPQLAKANQFNKKKLNERMLLELLKNVCGETILENRGIIKTVGTTPVDKKAEAQKDVLNVASLDDLSLTRKKEIVAVLELSLDSEEAEAIDIALTDYINTMKQPAEKDQNQEAKTEGSTTEDNKEVNQDLVKEESKEGKLPAEIERINKELQESSSLDDIPYSRKKQMINILDLTVENQKEVSYDAALTLYIANLDSNVQASDNKVSNDPKKKEGQE